MTSFNWQRIRESPIKFTGIIAWYGVHAVLLSLYRLATPLRPHSTNYVTAMKSLLLRTVFLKHYQFIYSTPPAALKAARCIKREGWSAYEFDANQNISLRHYDVVMLYFHGGGYAIGEPLQYAATYKRWKREAARRNIQLAIVGLRYPLTTEGKPYPAQKIAGIAAYRYLIDQEQVSSQRIILAGDSAGGNLAASILIYLRDNMEVPRPAGTILISPWLDPSLSRTSNSPFANVDFVYGDGTCSSTQVMASIFAGEGLDPSSPEISLALHTNLQGVPGHLCCYGSAEVYQEDSRMWIERCKADGVDVVEYIGQGGIHTFMLGGLTADSRLEKESDDVMIAYITKQVNLQKY